MIQHDWVHHYASPPWDMFSFDDDDGSYDDCENCDIDARECPLPGDTSCRSVRSPARESACQDPTGWLSAGVTS